MKKVLIITSYYPPQGGPGCIKLIKHLKYMRDSNWQPIVLTQKYNTFFAFDESLMEYVDDIPVYRFFSPDIGWIRKLIKGTDTDQEDRRWLASNEKLPIGKRIQSLIWKYLLIPDGKVGWILPLFLKALQVIRKENIDLVYVRLPVWSMGIAASLFSKFTRKPIIIDFDDEWIGFSLYYQYPGYRKAIERFLERRVVRNADLVISTTPRVEKEFAKRFPRLNPEKFRHITMGFDPDDFTNIEPELPPVKLPNGEQPFTLTYLGTFHEDIEPEGYFITPYYTYKALNIVREKRPDITEKLRFVIVGHLFDKLKHIAEEEGVTDLMHITGFLPHKQAMSYAAGSDVLLFVLYSRGRGPRQLPAKLYEYLAMNKPILSLVPESDGGDIIKETRTGIIVPPEEPQKIAEGIIDIFDKIQNGSLILDFNEDAIDRYRQANKTRELIEIFDEVVSNPRGYLKKRKNR